MINPSPGSKMLVPVPAKPPINTPTKPPSTAPDTAINNAGRKFDTINIPPTPFSLFYLFDNRIGKFSGFCAAA